MTSDFQVRFKYFFVAPRPPSRRPAGRGDAPAGRFGSGENNSEQIGNRFDFPVYSACSLLMRSCKRLALFAWIWSQTFFWLDVKTLLTIYSSAWARS